MVFTRRFLLWTLASGATAARAFALETNGVLPHFAARTMDGERITSESVKGKVVLIDFWATWCPPCKSDARSSSGSARNSKKTAFLFLR